MIDLKTFITAIRSSWITRIRDANIDTDAWAQLPKIYFDELIQLDSNLLFNFDETVRIPNMENIPYFYKNAFIGFNSAYADDNTTFQENIMNQFIWCNKFFTFNNGNKKNVLYLRNWIRSGVRKISDLSFVNGVLDMNSTYYKILDKTNIYCELLLVKDALYPFREAIHRNNILIAPLNKTYKSKDIYSMLMTKRYTDNNQYCSAYLICHGPLDKQLTAFKSKISLEKEIKLREFNFKVLHGILPCNNNLKKWKIKISSKCDVCDDTQTIRHLLFDCKYVKPLWNLVNTTFHLNISYPQLLGLDTNFIFNDIVTLISFLIYKEWLVLSLQNKSRNKTMAIEYFKNELLLRTKIYSLCKTIQNVRIDDIMQLISLM